MRLSNRLVKAAFWEDPKLLRMHRDARTLFHGLMHLADDSGCLEYDTFGLKMFLFRSPIDSDMTEEYIGKLISELLRHGLLRKFEASGVVCLYIVNFHKHQTLKNPSPPSCPLPPWVKWVPYDSNPSAGKYVVEGVTDDSGDPISDSKRISDEGGLDCLEASDDVRPELELELELEDIRAGSKSDADEPHFDAPQAAKPKGRDDYTDEFESFWELYPRKLGKRAAFRAWKARLREKVLVTDLMLAVSHYAEQCERLGTEQRYIRHGSTFLGPDKHYEDYIDGVPGADGNSEVPQGGVPDWIDAELSRYGGGSEQE